MSLVEGLEHILNRLSEALGVAIVGMDGMIVEERKSSRGPDLQDLSAECVGLLKSADHIGASLLSSGIRELSLVSEKQPVLIHRINPEYFLLLLLASDRELGKGRFQLRRAASRLEKELA